MIIRAPRTKHPSIPNAGAVFPASFFPFVLDVGVNAGANADAGIKSPPALAGIDTLPVLQEMACGVENSETPVNVVIANSTPLLPIFKVWRLKKWLIGVAPSSKAKVVPSITARLGPILTV
ncbi:hypothetical protein DID88_003137 [Monilinia fructigena]|uniref:Uncharacterized protein n=1 Tax=Monilinia fructigena TaxID=38457 RepID=A0A395J013_9HELO|nr:hypothetical protein DID88_003137 [Monilinia fructigena]